MSGVCDSMVQETDGSIGDGVLVDARQVMVQTPQFTHQHSRMGASRLADVLVDVQAEQRDEDIPARAGRVGFEKAVELALRQDDDAREDVKVHVQQRLFDVAVGILLLQELVELIAVLEDLNVLPRGCSLPDDPVRRAAKVEREGDVKLLGAATDDILALPVFCADAWDAPIEGIADRVDDRGLARTSLTYDGKQRQVAKVQGDRVAVGHEVLDFKRLYPHGSPPGTIHRPPSLRPLWRPPSPFVQDEGRFPRCM